MVSFGFSAQTRSLVRQLVITDFKLRYQGSVLGYVWSLLKPMLLFGMLYTIFTRVLPAVSRSVDNYGAYLLFGIVLWTFFVETTVNGMHSIMSRGDLVRKVQISKFAIVFSAMLSAFVNFCLNMIVVVVVMLISQVELRPVLLFLPLVLIELVLLALGLALWLSTLYVRFRDMSHVWDVVMQLLFYATPIIYTLDMIPTKMAQLLLLSPLAQIMQDARYILITDKAWTAGQTLPGNLGWFLPQLLVLFVLVTGILVFRANTKKFAEQI